MPDEQPVARQSAIEKRIDGAVNFYDDVAKRSMHKHFFWKTVQISSAALVPVAALAGPANVGKYFAAGLGALVIIAERIDSLHHYGDHYATWRFISEQLRAERYQYEVRAGVYEGASDADAQKKLVDRTEALTAQERQTWLALQQRAPAQQE